MKKLNRRKFLYGLGSTAIALPTMDFMLDSFGTAFASGEGLPQRFVLFNAATSLATSSNGPVLEEFTPQGLGPGFTVQPCMQALLDYNIKSDMSIFSGIYVSPYGEGGNGGYDQNFHGDAVSAKLTGVSHGDKFQGSESWKVFGRSADHVIADALAGQTTFKSLAYQMDSNPRGYTISFKRTSNGSYTWHETEASPASAYQRLFTNFSAPAELSRDNLLLRLRQSSISYVKDDLTKLRNYLGVNDRAKLDQHLQNIRDLETRLLASANTTGGSCQQLAIPTDPANIIGATGIPTHDINARSALFIDLIAMAFACDLTRSISFNVTPFKTGTGMYHPNWTYAFHDVQHYSTIGMLNEVNEWQFREYAKLVKKLKDTTEGANSNVLDNTAAVYIMEGGKAGRAADGGGDKNHSTDNMVMALAGRGGGLVPKGHLVKQDQHPMKIFNSICHGMGIPESEESEVKGYFADLFEP